MIGLVSGSSTYIVPVPAVTATPAVTNKSNVVMEAASSAVKTQLASSNVALSPEILSLLQEASSTDPLASLLGTDSESDDESIISQLLEQTTSTSSESLLDSAFSEKLTALAYEQAFSISV